MSNGKNFMRHDRTDSSTADPRAVQSRQRETRKPTQSWDWVTEKSELVTAYRNMLHGKVGLYPVSGVQLEVVIRGTEGNEYPVLVYYDALYGADGHGLCGMIQSGFWMNTEVLTWAIGPNTKWTSDDQEMLTLTLLAQPEMQVAREQFARERFEAERSREQAKRKMVDEGRANLLAKLRADAGGNTEQKQAKAEPLLLGSISEILTAACGTIAHDNLTILVCRGPQGGNVVRIKDVPNGHDMTEVAMKNVFAHQDTLHFSDDRYGVPTDQSESINLAYKLRMYLRAQLVSNGVILTLPATGDDKAVGGNGKGAYVGKGPGVEVSLAS